MEKAPHNSYIVMASSEDTLRLISGIFVARFSRAKTGFVTAVFQQTEQTFAGQCPGYQACDTPYHDFAHTCQAAVAVARILDGHFKSKRTPTLSARDFELGIAAILLHDIGFLKNTGDSSGTGAKHAFLHVERSIQIAEESLPRLGVTTDEFRIVELAIRSTVLNADMGKLGFRDERERMLGCVVGTGDLLGAMAAPDYPEKLAALYEELAEVVDSRSDASGTDVKEYKSVEDLMGRTRQFHRRYAEPMLNEQWGQVYRELEYHFADGGNPYLEAIEANLNRIDQLLCNRF
ncbi:MAG TPA: hypothetical protein VL171_13985 [Verrucomicrobiae bacterium]|nr:hypothetical protein [Verrucomicrobiae bacterium]